MTTRETAPTTTPWPYFLKRLHDQKQFKERVGPGPWKCGAGEDCLLQGWHDAVTGLPKGPVDGGMVQQGDVTAIVAEGMPMAQAIPPTAFTNSMATDPSNRGFAV